MRKLGMLGVVVVLVSGSVVPVWANNGANAANPENAGEVHGTVVCDGQGLPNTLVYVSGQSPMAKLDASRHFILRVVFEATDFIDTKGISFRVSSDGQRLY